MTGSDPVSYRSKTIQRVRDLISDKRVRESEHAFVIEGESFVRDAVRFGATFDCFVIVEGKQSIVDDLGVPVHLVDSKTMERLSDTQTPSGIIAVVIRTDVLISDLAAAESIVVCDGISDPGNAGTIVRSASAAGFGAVVFMPNSVDVFNPKVVRSSAAALLSVSIVVNADWNDLSGWTTVGLDANAKQTLWDFELPQRMALVVGNEAHGLSNKCDETVSIPVANEIESLNAAMAATVACFEVARRSGGM